MKALIKVGYGCNEHCSFCHTLDVRHVEGEASEVHAKIERAKALGHSMVILSGGEPTIRPELVAWARHVKSLGMGFGLVTNGLMLAYPELVEKLLEQRLEYVYLSMHGGTARVHNLMVRTDAYDKTYAALQNLSGRGLDLTVNCVITRHNVEHLRGVVDACLPFADAKVKFSMVEPKGGGDKLFDHLMPRIADVADHVRDALEHGARSVQARGTSGPRFFHGGVPLCLLPGHERAYRDLRTDEFATMVEIGEPDFFPVDDLNKVQPEDKCGLCTLRGACPGLYKGYEESFGSDELRPRLADAPGAGARANSFDWTFEAMVTSSMEEGACPIRADGVTPWEHARHLFVRNGPRVARYRAESRDFSDVELERLKHGRKQVYLDASRGKDAPDDFARDLVRLERSRLCDDCAEKPRCTGLYEPLLEPVFARDDAWLRDRIGVLEGDLLDVGCGEGPYEDTLAPRARAGSIRYVGVDPEASRIDALRTRREWATLEVGTAEEIDAEDAYDVALVVRSWNHLRDPDRAMRNVIRALRPGGTLLVADDEAFGLARTKAQTMRARGGKAGLEHVRNDGAEEAWSRLEALGGLSLVTRRDADRSTLWVLELRRD